ncbi:hypothetical protein BLNAU_12459 [Blattamonas nauphoetae]|uniref:Secreted protein n=1 Tax=Blattamonas nauphoetae TaxID=2049346 RepID=A0ABQ9XQR5_9EUKA|nr:hypothetical protein BLNAU_12459 [Blattamonas nauphoetae]
MISFAGTIGILSRQSRSMVATLCFSFASPNEATNGPTSIFSHSCHSLRQQPKNSLANSSTASPLVNLVAECIAVQSNRSLDLKSMSMSGNDVSEGKFASARKFTRCCSEGAASIVSASGDGADTPCTGSLAPNPQSRKMTQHTRLLSSSLNLRAARAPAHSPRTGRSTSSSAGGQ